MKPNISIKLVSLVAILCCFSFTSIAQKSYTEYKGIIKDIDSKDELIFADVSIVGTNVSTITNNEGEFLIKIPNDLNNPNLSFSYLGFKEKILTLQEFTNLRRSTVFLIPAATELSQVNIVTIKDAEALVKAMLSKKGDNYGDSKNVMTAFYRETIKNRRRNASLSEAVVDIYKAPYTSSRNDKIDLIKARKSVDYTKLDTVAVKLLGGPFSALYTDMIKYQQFVFTYEDLKDYDFTFDNASKVNNRDVYVVNFKQKEAIDYPLYFGKLYIDSESFALVSATYSLNISNRELASKMFIRKKPRKVKVWPTKASYRVDYRIKNDQWYYGYSNIALTFKVNWEQRLFNSVYTLNSEMAVTDWKENTSDNKPNNPIRPSMILSEEASGFSDPGFWGEYNIIEPEKSIESAIKKINKKLKKSS